MELANIFNGSDGRGEFESKAKLGFVVSFVKWPQLKTVPTRKWSQASAGPFPTLNERRLRTLSLVGDIVVGAIPIPALNINQQIIGRLIGGGRTGGVQSRPLGYAECDPGLGGNKEAREYQTSGYSDKN